MNASSTTRETLSREGFERCRPVSGEGGRSWRAFCPFHGSDHQRSLRLTQETGRFACFACGAWGYLADHDQVRPNYPLWISPARPLARKVTPPLDLSLALSGYQAALVDSWGEQYLRSRGIPLALARRLGVGYAGPGKWLHASRDWKWGRLVFPHTDPNGRVLNLYGRAVGSEAKVPKAVRHDHLPGTKGFFNGPDLMSRATVYVCEGPFDALSLLAAGVDHVVAIFGVDGWNWSWAEEAQKLVFAMDNDVAGQRWKDIARGALLRGKGVSFLEESCYGGCKDINEAWRLGALQI